MEGGRKIKRGEVIFKEGDTPQAVYMIQVGKIGLMLDRGGKLFEVIALGPSQVLGEHALFSNSRHEFTAIALQETRVLEVPIEIMKQQFEKCPPGIKLLVKSLTDQIRQAYKQIKASRMETEKAPCPQGLVHRLFTEVHLISRHIGRKDPRKPDEVKVAWDALKLYATRFFGESPQRLRHLMDLLLKLKYAEFTVRMTEEQEEELSDVSLTNVQVLEDFAEFYQYYLYKGGRSEAIYVDPLALKVAKAFAELSVSAPVDHRGASKLDWTAVLNECKTKYRIDLKSTHLDILEKKGLFVNRQSFDDGRVELSLDRGEFERMSKFWAIIHEIDKWNERGSIDLHEKEEVAQITGEACPQCGGPVDESHKFCPHCGFKLQQAQAA
jgi:CRP-like cAMP-binding protein